MFPFITKSFVESISDKGLQQLRLSEFQAKIEIDVSILDRLAEKANNLQVLTIRDMNRTSEQVREALVHLTVQIANRSPPITSLWLSRLGSSEEGDKILEALCTSTITSVRYLNFGDNSSWMTSQSASQMLVQFITRQD